jgi:hypothetical protein
MADTAEKVQEVPANGGGGRGSFWTSLPGVLTALAAVISAAVPLYLHFNDGGSGPRDRPEVPPVVHIHMDGGTLAQVSQDDASLDDPVAGCIGGSAPACNQVAEILVEQCDRDSPEACDWLYELTDEGSDLEWFGATCGDRFDTDLYAGRCATVR